MHIKKILLSCCEHKSPIKKKEMVYFNKIKIYFNKIKIYFNKIKLKSVNSPCPPNISASTPTKSLDEQLDEHDSYSFARRETVFFNPRYEKNMRGIKMENTIPRCVKLSKLTKLPRLVKLSRLTKLPHLVKLSRLTKMKFDYSDFFDCVEHT
jgi:hypothetical protein